MQGASAATIPAQLSRNSDTNARYARCWITDAGGMTGKFEVKSSRCG